MMLFLLAWGAVAHGELARPSLERLKSQRDGARLQRMRWERVIATHADLAQHPEKFAGAAVIAAEELKMEGRALTVEGVTMGLSGACETMAEVMKESDWRTAKKLVDAATEVEAAHKLFLEDLAKGKQDPRKINASIEKVSAVLKVAARSRNKKSREELGALLSIATPTLKLLSGLMSGEKRTSEEDYALMKDLLSGMRAMMLAYIQHRDPGKWISTGSTIAKTFPKVGEFAGVVTKEGLPIANVLNGVANASFGAYAWHEGVQLENLAEELRDNQQQAAKILQALLPHAQQARKSALRRELRLERIIRSLERGTPLVPKSVLPPSRRILDDGKGTPPQLYFGLRASLQTVLQNSTPLTYHLTNNEIRRREEIRRAEIRAERARQEAAELARRREQREQAHQRDQVDQRERHESVTEHGGHVDTEKVQAVIQRITHEVTTRW